jgi:DNA-binding NarL/FixJ family response regulator
VESHLIRVGIVDDHPVVRDGTAALLDRQDGIEVVGTAGGLDEAAALLAPDAVDVVLLDIRLGADSGLTLLERRSDAGGPAIVILSAYDYPQYAEAALRLGAAGFVLKTAPVRDLVDAIKRAAAGGFAFQVRPGPAMRLSVRELDVVKLVIEGLSNDEIGVRLGIGIKTVETHLHRIFTRFDVRSRTELAARALGEGWVDTPRP